MKNNVSVKPVKLRLTPTPHHATLRYPATNVMNYRGIGMLPKTAPINPHTCHAPLAALAARVARDRAERDQSENKFASPRESLARCFHTRFGLLGAAGGVPNGGRAGCRDVVPVA